MSNIYNELFVVGISIFIGLIIGRIFDRIGIPEIIGMVLTGLILGPGMLGILKADQNILYKQVVDLVLAFFGFFIGSELRINELRKLGKYIISILIFEVITVFSVVFTGIYLMSGEWTLAILLAALSVSTAPAATADVIWEHKADGPLSTTVLALIGFDDIIAVLVYTLVTVYTYQAIGLRNIEEHPLSYFLTHVGYSVLVGLALGGALIFIGSMLRKRRDIIILTIGLVVFASGIVEIFNASELITSLIIGFIYENYFKEPPLSIDLLRDLTSPIFTLFFVIIGSQLSFFGILEAGILGAVYVACSLIGKTFGAKLGAAVSNAEDNIRRYIGFTLYSQAGLALGLSQMLYYELISGGVEIIRLGTIITNIVTSSALVLLVIGPLSLRYALIKSGEAYRITREELILED